MAEPEIKIEPKRWDIVVEVTGYVALAALWVFVSLIYYKLPDVVPTHFNLAGEADGFGDKKTIFVSPIVASFQFFILSVLMGYPHLFNYPVEITPENALKQYTNAVRMMRILKVVLVAVFGIIEVYSASDYIGLRFDGIWLTPVLLSLLVVPLGYFIYRAFKQKQA